MGGKGTGRHIFRRFFHFFSLLRGVFKKGQSSRMGGKEEGVGFVAVVAVTVVLFLGMRGLYPVYFSSSFTKEHQKHMYL